MPRWHCLAVVALYVLALGTTNSYRTELVRISTLASRFRFHLMACVVTLLPFLLASLLTLHRRWTALECLLPAHVVILCTAYALAHGVRMYLHLYNGA